MRRNLVAPFALFGLAGALAIYAAWAFTEVQGTVQEAVAAGQLVLAGSEFDVASFYMTSSGEYAVFAVVLAVLGWLLLRSARRATEPAAVRPTRSSEETEETEKTEGTDDDDLDDLLDAAFDRPHPPGP